ncbi:MAG: hypothetical protein FWF32_07770 [Endomicrobia bacterium]|nr:hypothetical protein [Endomicrobiia bacterium]
MSESKEKKRRESVHLDETVKLLFEVSKELLVQTLNSLFNEKYSADSVTIDKTATEYPKNDFSMLRADIFIKITEHKPHHFHVEVETEPSNDIAVRVFEYDVMKAISNWRLEGNTTGTPELFMPKSVVIHIEGGGSIPQKHHSVKLNMADGKSINYTAKIMRYWEYDKDRLIKEKLYTLLPLQVFMLRDELDRMTKKGDKEALQGATLKARNLTREIANEIIKVHRKNKISFYDADRVLLALQELFTHLNNRYSGDEKLNSEVKNMVRTLIDENMRRQLEQAEEKVENRAIEIAIGLFDVLDVETIAKKTKLSLEKVLELKEKHFKG